MLLVAEVFSEMLALTELPLTAVLLRPLQVGSFEEGDNP